MAENNKKSFFDFFKTKKGKYIAIGAGAVVGIAAITGIAVAASQGATITPEAKRKAAHISAKQTFGSEILKLKEFINGKILDKKVSPALAQSANNTSSYKDILTAVANKFKKAVALVKEHESKTTKEGDAKVKYEKAEAFLVKTEKLLEEILKSDTNIFASDLRREQFKDMVRNDATDGNLGSGATVTSRRVLVPVWLKFQNEVIKRIEELETAKTNATEVENLKKILGNEGATVLQIEDFRTLANVELKKAGKSELAEFNNTEKLVVNFQKLADLGNDLEAADTAKKIQTIVKDYQAVTAEILKYEETSTETSVDNDSLLRTYLNSFDATKAILDYLGNKINNFNSLYKGGKYGKDDAYDGAVTLATELIYNLNIFFGGTLQTEPAAN